MHQLPLKNYKKQYRNKLVIRHQDQTDYQMKYTDIQGVWRDQFARVTRGAKWGIGKGRITSIHHRGYNYKNPKEGEGSDTTFIILTNLSALCGCQAIGKNLGQLIR